MTTEVLARTFRRGFAEARILGAPAARLALGIAGVALGVALVAGSLRVLPVLLAPGVPLGIALPLARGVVLVGLEVALFVAPPIAWALAASRLVERGDVRALQAIGVRSSRAALGAAPHAAIWALAAAMASFVWGRDAVAPGHLARELLVEAREACVAAPPPAAVDLPLLDLSWVCLPGEAPRVVGLAPLRARPAYFAAASVEIAEDMRTLHLGGLEMLVPARTQGAGDARVSVASATITGFAPFARGSNLAPAARGGLLGATTFLLAALAAFAVVVRSATSPVAAIAIGLAGPLASLAAFSSLERAPASPFLYAVVPIAGASALAVAAGALTRRARPRPSRPRPR